MPLFHGRRDRPHSCNRIKLQSDMAVSSKKKALYRLLEKILARKTDRIVTISEYEKRIAIKNKICIEDKIEVILNGIDLEKCRAVKAERAALRYKETDFIIGCAARLSEQKDPLLFAEVAGCVAQKCPDARFIWVGDGEQKENFITALKKNHVFDKTKITGWVDNPCEYIAAFDVAVLFSKWEGFGLCLAEYLALGKPVVATNVGAVSEIIQDGICGKLVEHRDPERIADEIEIATRKEDIKLVEDSKKWILSPERKASKREKQYALDRLDGVVKKIEYAITKTISKMKNRLLKPENKNIMVQEIKKEVKPSILKKLSEKKASITRNGETEKLNKES